MQPGPAIGLGIFDCDGVLVDCKGLSAQVLLSKLSDIGLDLNFY